MLDSRTILLLRIWMFLKESLDFAQNFIKSVNKAIKLETPGKALSRAQCYWLSFCITAAILTNSVCMRGGAKWPSSLVLMDRAEV